MHVAPPLVRDALQQLLHHGLLAHVMLRPTTTELDLIRGPALLPQGRAQAAAAAEDLQGACRRPALPVSVPRVAASWLTDCRDLHLRNQSLTRS